MSETNDAAEAIAEHGATLATNATNATTTMASAIQPSAGSTSDTRPAATPATGIPRIELSGSAPNYLSKQARGKLFGWSTGIAVACVVLAFITFAVWNSQPGAATLSSLFLGVSAIALVVAYLAVGGFGTVQLSTTASTS